MNNFTSEYDKFKALEEAINDANLQAHSQPIDQGVDLEALVLANWNECKAEAMDEIAADLLYGNRKEDEGPPAGLLSVSAEATDSTPQYIMSHRTRKVLKRKANSRRQRWFNEVRRV